MTQTLTIATWSFMGLAIVFFWLSLRSETDQMWYSGVALVAIAAAFAFNKILKKHEKKD